MSTFNGKNISVEIFGESHSERIGVAAKGFPTFKFDLDKLNSFLDRREASGQIFATARRESDTPIFDNAPNGQINGAFTAIITNTDVKSQDYAELVGKPRPSHADYAWFLKDGATNFTGGGRFSGRMTAPLCVVGGIAKQYLESLGIKIYAYVKSIGQINGKSYKDGNVAATELENLISSGAFPARSNADEMIREIADKKSQGDSLGGVIECIVYGMKPGVGDCLFEGLEGKIASLIYSVPAVKGVEFGDGFAITQLAGSVANDGYRYEGGKVELLKNSSGGINGGISNGANITLSVAIRPTPSIAKEQDTVDLINKVNTKISIKGRHDACIVPRAVPCIESAVALAILDEIL